jgi:hypothetical protein
VVAQRKRHGGHMHAGLFGNIRQGDAARLRHGGSSAKDGV